MSYLSLALALVFPAPAIALQVAAVEALLPADAWISLRIQDPAGLLAGPRGAHWEPILADPRWTDPLLFDAEAPPDAEAVRTALRETYGAAREAVLFAGGNPEVPETQWLGWAFRGNVGLGEALQGVFRGSPAPVPEGFTGIQSGPNLLAFGRGLCLVLHGTEAESNRLRLAGMLERLDHPPKVRSDVWALRGLSEERRGDDWEAALNLAAWWPLALAATAEDLGPSAPAIQHSLASIPWAYASGSLDAAGHWRIRSVLPYGTDTLLGSLLACSQPIDPTLLQRLPGRCCSAFMLSLNMPKLWDWMEQVLPTIEPSTEQEFQNAKREFQATTGLELRKDCLDLLGPAIFALERQVLGADKSTQASNGKEWSIGFEFGNLPAFQQALLAILKLDSIETQPAPKGQGLLWSFRFLFSEIQGSRGASQVHLTTDRDWNLELLQTDAAVPSPNSLAAWPLWEGFPTLTGRCLLQVQSEAGSSEPIDALAEVMRELLRARKSHAGDAFEILPGMLNEHWRSLPHHFTVLQVSTQAGRVEAWLSTH